MVGYQESRSRGSSNETLRTSAQPWLVYRLDAQQSCSTALSDYYMMPNALKVPEAVVESAAEVARSSAYLPDAGTLVISISSGTVASGVIRGLAFVRDPSKWRLLIHMGYARSHEKVFYYMRDTSGVDLGLFQSWTLVDEGYGYRDEAPKDSVQHPPCPFPCNTHYDLKAWRWLQNEDNLKSLVGPILFWNIGD